MHICYLDESGTPEKTGNTGHFVLLGLAVPAQTWKKRDDEITAIKLKYDLQDKEIHTAWLLRDYPEQRRVADFENLDWEARRKSVIAVRTMNLARPRTNSQQKELLKNYRKSQDYIHLARAERFDLAQNLADVVGNWNDARIFADAHDKKHTQNVEHFDFAFEQVVTRFNTFLASPKGQYGLLVQDNNQTVASKLTHTMRQFHAKGTPWGNIGHIIETPLFVDSALTSMVQMADLCAYATRRFLEKGETDLFNRIKPRIQFKHGALVGIRHFTGKFECHCVICEEHGRYPQATAAKAVAAVAIVPPKI